MTRHAPTEIAVARGPLPGIERFALWILSAAVLAWAWLDPRFRDTEGFLDTAFCLPLAISAASWLMGTSLAVRWRQFERAACWIALAVVGQAVQFQLTKAGTNVAYQHLRPPGTWLRECHPFLPAFVVGQLMLVCWGLRRLWSPGRAWLSRRFRLWQLVCIAGVFFLGSATKINIPVPTFVTELLAATFLQLLSLLTIVLAAFALPHRLGSGSDQPSALRWLDRLLSPPSGAPGAHDRMLDRFVLLAALWVVLVSYGLCVFSYERHPHIPDEVLYAMHARYFAEGSITLPTPEVPEAIQLYLMESDGDRWYSPVPPGWPAVLAVGMWLGAPWLVNPILGGLIVLGTYVLLQHLYDRRTARLAVLVMCSSPWFLFMNMNLMTHTASLAFALLAVLGVMWARASGRALWGWVSGMALGFVGLIRPLEGLALAVLLGLWAIGLGGRRLRPAALLGLVLGAGLMGAVVLPYNKHLTGNPLRFPIMAYVDKHFGEGKNSLGFGPEKGLGWRGVDPFPGHGAIDVAMNAHLNVHSINTELLGWGTGSLLLMAIAVFASSLTRSDRLMLAVMATVSGIHSFYWYSGGPDFGARYWYFAFIPAVALTVRGLRFVSSKLEDRDSGTAVWDMRPVALFMALCLATLVTFLPWRAIDKYHHFRKMRPDIRDLADKHAFGRSLVLINGNAYDDYASAFPYNPVDLRADAPIYAWDKNADVRAKLLEAYADRPVWLVNGSAVTGGAFEVVAGPLTAQEVSAMPAP